MKKIKLDDATTDKLQAQHLRVQVEIEKLPQDQQKQIKAIQKLVDHEINENNALFFNDGMFAADAFLKRNNLSGSDKEDLADVIRQTKKGEIFIFRNKAFIKSYDGLVHSVKDYITSLELTIVEQVEYREVKYTSYITEFGFLDLIKLAFKKLLKGDVHG